MRSRASLPVIGVVLVAHVAAFAAEAPVAVSPGDTSKLATIESRCPTFSWGAVPGAKQFELVVYRIGKEGEQARPVLSQRISGSALSWTPSLNRCLERHGQYAWSIRAVVGRENSDWSPPSLFEVASGPSEAEFEDALQVVRQYLVTQGGAEAEKVARARAEREAKDGPEASASTPGTTAVGATQLTVDGGVEATSFTGDGSTLINVDADLLDGLDATSFASGAALGTHLADTANPHQVTASQTSPTTTKGDLEVHDGAGIARLPAGSNGQVLTAEAATASGLAWADESGGVPTGESCPVGYVLAGFDAQGDLLCRAGKLQNNFDVKATVPEIAVAVGADGRPVIAFIINSVPDEVFFGRCSDDACTALETTQVGTQLAPGLDIAVGTDLLPILAFNDKDDNLVVTHCDNASCSTRTTLLLEISGRSPSIAIGSDGIPVIAFVDFASDLKIARCTDVACTDRTLETVVPTATVSSPAIAIGATNPIVAFRDEVLTRLRLVVCNNLTCSLKDVNEVDNLDDTGRNPSVALGGDNFPVIAYDHNDGQLIIAHCTNPGCTAIDRNGIDTPGTMVASSSISIGVDGLPLIVYRIDADELFVYRCLEPTCFSASRNQIGGASNSIADVAIGDDDLPFVVWGAGPGVTTLHCGDPNCS